MFAVRKAFLALSLLALACAQPISMNGFVLEQEDTISAMAKVRECAVTQLSCEADQLKFDVLDIRDDAGPDMVETFAVSGCGQVGIFTRNSDSWFVQSIQVPNPEDEKTAFEMCPDCPRSCAWPSLRTNGFKLEEEDTAAALAEVRGLASLQLKCSPEDLVLTVTAVLDDAGDDMVTTFEVVGCGQVAIYVRKFLEVPGSDTVDGGFKLDYTGAEGTSPPPKEDAEECKDGTVGCACYGNGTCNDGLLCDDSVCRAKG